VRNALKKASHPVQIGDISNKDGSLSFMVSNPAEVDAAREACCR
jgi:preprotein translocase subunit SecD